MNSFIIARAKVPPDVRAEKTAKQESDLSKNFQFVGRETVRGGPKTMSSTFKSATRVNLTDGKIGPRGPRLS